MAAAAAAVANHPCSTSSLSLPLRDCQPASSLSSPPWKLQEDLHYLFKGNQNPIAGVEDANYGSSVAKWDKFKQFEGGKELRHPAMQCEVSSHGIDNRCQKRSENEPAGLSRM